MSEHAFKRALAKGQYRRASRILKDIKENLPRKEALFLEGSLLEAKGELTEALKRYDMALVLHLSDEKLWLAKANVLMEIGKLDIAKRASDRACKLSHRDWKAHLLCADILYKMKDYQEALKQIDHAIEYGADSAEALTLKGILVSIIDQDFRQALGFFDNAIEADENYARAWANRGVALRQIGDKDGALYSFQKALMLDPDDSNSRKMIEKMGHGDILDAFDGREEDEEIEELEEDDEFIDEEDLDWDEE